MGFRSSILCGIAATAFWLVTPAVAGTLAPVSRSAPNSVFASPNGASDTSPRFGASADAGIVAFTSSATNLVPGQFDLNGQPDVFVLERGTGTVTLLTRRHGTATTTGDGSASNPIVSADGSHVAFLSSATDLLEEPLPADGSINLYVWDRASQTLALVTRHLGEDVIGSTFAGGAAFSDDGRWLAFASTATDLVVDQNEQNNDADVFLYDTQTGNLALVSRQFSIFDATTTGNGGSGGPQISADGRFIAYLSQSTDLVQGQIDLNGGADVFLFDRDAPMFSSPTKLVSRATNGSAFAANAASDNPAISRDGSAIAFTTQATNLVAGITDTNNDSDVYVYARVAGTLTLVSHNAASLTTASVRWSGNPALSPDGRYVLHTSASNNVIAGQIDGSISDDLFLFDRNDASLVLLSHIPGFGNVTGANDSLRGFYSNDGSRIVFTSRANNLVAGQVDTNDDNDPLLGNDVFVIDPANVAAGAKLVSHAAGQPGVAGKRMSYTPSANADGSQIIYVSESDELPAGDADANAATDLLVWSAVSDQSSLLTKHATGADPATLMGASQVRVSADGGWIAFASPSPRIVAGQDDVNREDDLFLLERATGAVRLVSHVPGSATTAGNRGVALTSTSNIAISADGRYIAFETNATNLGSGVLDGNQRPDIVLFDRLAPSTAALRVVSANGGNTGDLASTVPKIAADGSAIVFMSEAGNLLPGGTDTNGGNDVYRYDVATQTLSLVSRAAGSPTTAANARSDAAVIADDGATVAYLSLATNLVAGQADANGAFDVFVFDATTGTNTLVSHTNASPTMAAGAPAIITQAPVVSGDGAVVAFASEANNLVANFQNGIQFPVGARTQVYRWNRAGNVNALLSRAFDGFGNPSGDAAATLPSISADGTRIAFQSAATNLVDGQNDDQVTDDVFLWDNGTLRIVSHAAGDPRRAVGGAQDRPLLSANGARIAYGLAGTAVAAQTEAPDGQPRLFLYGVDADVSSLVNHSVLGARLGSRAYAERPDIDAGGDTLVFLTPTPDLVDFDGNAFRDAYVFRRGSLAPLLTVPNDATLDEDVVAGPLPVDIDDADSAANELALAVTSSDPSVLPPENIALTPVFGGFTLTATPLSEAAGSATVTLQVSDTDANGASGSFTLTWNAVNDPPTVQTAGDQITLEDTPLGPLAVTVGDVESGPDGVMLTAHSSNQGIVPDAGLVLDGSGADRTLTIAPAPNANGTVTITLTAQDPAPDGSAGVAAFTLTVTPVNDVPFIIAPDAIAIATDGTSGPRYFGVSDIETPSAQLVVQVQSSNETLLPTANVVLEGSGQIRTLTATPLPGQTGTAHLTLMVTDMNGASRNAGVDVTVGPLADAIFADGFE